MGLFFCWFVYSEFPVTLSSGDSGVVEVKSRRDSRRSFTTKSEASRQAFSHFRAGNSNTLREIYIKVILSFSEVEAIDILPVEDEGRSEQDLITFNFNSAETTGIQLAVTGCEFILTQSARGVDGQITQIHRVPQMACA